jgi:TolB-like protein
MRVQFGSFELDTERGRLLKHGIPVRLREQPLQVLVALLERPGDVVTRDDLRRRLWRHDTFVDFEVGLNSAISRLRRALNDPAEAPRLIETLPKRGYRFIGSVPRQLSVAVMPFVNQTSDRENEYFCDGLTDELIRALSRIDGLRVAARSVVSRYTNQTFELKQVGKEIGVDTVLDGSIQHVAEKVRVSVHIVNVRDGFEIWADRFDSEWKDVFAIQDRIADAVAEALKVRLGIKPPGDSPRNAEAYKAYLKGHHLVKRHTPSNLRRGLEYFEDAIRLDPNYALPYHGAGLYYILGALMGDLDARNALPNAEDLLSNGLALDAGSAMLQNTLGMLRMFQWRWVDAEQAFERAIALEPANSYPHMMYALLCSFLGRHDEASRQALKALDLDPIDPMTNFRAVQSLYYARRYEEALRRGLTAMELAQDFPYTRWYVALSLAALGRQPEAWALAREKGVLDFVQPLHVGHFGYLAGVSGHPDEALALIEKLKARRAIGYSPALPIAWTHLGLADFDACLEWLQTAAAGHEPYLGCIGVFPAHDPLREYPAFIELERRIMAGDHC